LVNEDYQFYSLFSSQFVVLVGLDCPMNMISHFILNSLKSELTKLKLIVFCKIKTIRIFMDFSSVAAFSKMRSLKKPLLSN